MSSWIASMYSCSSLIGLVSSKRRWQRPPNSWAIPKLSAIDLGWPMWRYPFGSGGKRVTTSETLPSRTSAATISRMKSLRSGVARLSALSALLLIVSKRLVEDVAMSGPSQCHGRLIALDDAIHVQYLPAPHDAAPVVTDATQPSGRRRDARR